MKGAVKYTREKEEEVFSREGGEMKDIYLNRSTGTFPFQRQRCALEESGTGTILCH